MGDIDFTHYALTFMARFSYECIEAVIICGMWYIKSWKNLYLHNVTHFKWISAKNLISPDLDWFFIEQLCCGINFVSVTHS